MARSTANSTVPFERGKVTDRKRLAARKGQVPSWGWSKRPTAMVLVTPLPSGDSTVGATTFSNGIFRLREIVLPRRRRRGDKRE